MNYTYLSCFHFLRSVTNVYTTGTLLLTLISSDDCYDSNLIIIELIIAFTSSCWINTNLDLDQLTTVMIATS